MAPPGIRSVSDLHNAPTQRSKVLERCSFRVEAPVGDTFRSSLLDGGSVIDFLLLRGPACVKSDVVNTTATLQPGEHQILVGEVHWELSGGGADRLVRPSILNSEAVRAQAFAEYQDTLLVVDNLFNSVKSQASLDSAVSNLSYALRSPFVKGFKPHKQAVKKKEPRARCGGCLLRDAHC